MSTPADTLSADHPMRATRTSVLASWLLHALTQELESCGGGPAGVSLIAPGGAPPPADWVCLEDDDGQRTEGMAWVRVNRRYPSGNFPGQATSPRACTGTAAEMELGVYRCAATIDSDGVPPDPADVTADALKIDADSYAITAAIARMKWPYVLGGWTVLGPTGGVVGGAQTFTVLLSQGPIGRELP